MKGAGHPARTSTPLGWRLHAALIAPALAFFSPALFFGRALYLRDNGLYFFPHKALIADALRHGRLPQWNPFEYGGVPLLADPNFNAFHPLSLLTDLLPLPWGFSLFVAANAVAAAYGGYLLSRALGLTERAAVVAALCYAWSGPFVSLLESGQAVAPAMLPWMCWAGAWGASRGARGMAAVAGAAALTLLAGTPEIGACALALGFLVALGETDKKSAAAARYLFSIGLGAGLAAIQLAPAALFLRHSSRAGGWTFREATQYSLHPLRLLNLAFPFFAGSVDAPGAISWSSEPALAQPYVQEIYAGAVPLLLAGAGLFAAGGRRRAWLVVPAALLVPLALGRYTPLYHALWDVLPPLRVVRFPEKLIVPLALAVAVSAGAGWTHALGWLERATVPAFRALASAWVTATVFCFGALTLFMAGPYATAKLGEARADCLLATLVPSLATELALASLALLALLLGATGKLKLPRAALVGAALLAVDLALPAARMDFTIPSAELTQPSPVDDVLRRDAAAPAWTFRVDAGHRASPADVERAGDADWPRPRKLFWLRHLALFGAGAALDGVYQDRGYSGFTPGALKALYTSADPAAVYALLGVRYAVEYGTAGGLDYARFGFTPMPKSPTDLVRLWRNAAARPKARLVAHVAGDHGLPSCDAVWLPAAARALAPPAAKDCADTRVPEGTAEVLRYEPERVEVSVDARAPALVLLNDTWDAGWSATVDGAKVISLAAFGALRAVAVPAGTHVVEWRYRTPGLAAGAAVSLASLALLALLLFWPRRAKAE